MNIGIDHGYYAIKTRHCSFPAGITAYSHEPLPTIQTREAAGMGTTSNSTTKTVLKHSMPIAPRSASRLVRPFKRAR